MNIHSSRDYDFFYQGLSAKRILVQKCSACGKLRNPPGPSCPSCRSLEWGSFELDGSGIINSYTIHYHPPLPGFDVPHTILLVDMDEGVKLVGALASCTPGEVAIGMPVQARFDDDLAETLYRFHLLGNGT
jgi:hypothetical protein